MHTHFGYAVVVRSINCRCNCRSARFGTLRASCDERGARWFVVSASCRALRCRCLPASLPARLYLYDSNSHSVFYDARIVTDAQSRTLAEHKLRDSPSERQRERYNPKQSSSHAVFLYYQLVSLYPKPTQKLQLASARYRLLVMCVSVRATV